MDGDAFVREVGARVLRARLEREKTRSEVARGAGLNDVTLWRVENGIGVPTLINFCRIAKAIGVAPASLLPPDMT